MKDTSSYRYIIVLFFLCLFAQKANGQLGFCNGHSGDPIFAEDFGSGTTIGPALPAGTTSYSFANGAPADGSYTISSATDYFDWHDTQDHTPNDINGKSFIVNADFIAGEFFKRTVDNLCENTSYEFSSWLLNLLPTNGCLGTGLPINVKFQIWDSTDTNLLASGNTGDIATTSSAKWQQFGLVFQTLPGQSSVILKMINNGVGGCGNDLAIDDIVFKTCGDFIDITDQLNNTNIAICQEEAPISAQLIANPDFSIYSTHVYQWQESTDGSNWTDIASETSQTYTTPALISSMFYRVKVAEDIINLANPLCSSLSEVFDILIITKPNSPVSNGNLTLCENVRQAISVTVPKGVLVNWYDAEIGGNVLQVNSNSYLTDVPGTYYSEAISSIADCFSDLRTPVVLSFNSLPQVTDETLTFCEDSSITLNANINNVSYLWNTGETSKEINVSSPGTYSVEVTNINGCSATKTIILNQIDAPIIADVISDNYSLIINTTQAGDFEYSLDGIAYQESNIFSNVSGGLYTIRARERNGCGIASMETVHFVIPTFFTPNGDTVNDTFSLEGIEYFNTSEVSIFDRYGKLIKNTKNSPLSWDGTFNNRKLPAADYWYKIRIDGTMFHGHFALKR